MTLTDNGECTQKLVFAVTFRRYGIILQIRLDADDIVCTLVAYNSCCRNINHFDILGHDNVRGHFNAEFAESVKSAIQSVWDKAEVKIVHARGLCSYYAEKGGLIIGF